ncbi:hypothetical protein J8I87_29755 [Paraburkholderia sp. LEh10]|uniref:hypothetical protein n=1 Tax=Paraburkholderia sp. LEh10 TaxID=2821353 RepID=UPI001AEA04D5|nr:hypothetical protein [Paraburkholderia sp. LEh10]MBP0593799.1 hypothetical protein [Paraburkholderia sp. LEh10]
MTTSKRSKSGDDGNGGFMSHAPVAHHKPGIEYGTLEREREANGDHRFRRSEQNRIPQRSLADRISNPRKGE